ncbi:type II toxin-antitoxin system prevent-host-death family antitoxin [Streptomyces tubercidicus]|uniref:type II toxin-antitoxin system prevent-host-death family antitoxin n=1 Tax=Streptomyces tubercidicus TaxID=47759 RepID=UPI0034670EE0
MPLARRSEGQEHRALLVSPAAAEAAGCDLTAAPSWPTAQARKKLGDLIQQAAEGHPQVLRRHSTAVAVLIPETATHPASAATAPQQTPEPAPKTQRPPAADTPAAPPPTQTSAPLDQATAILDTHSVSAHPAPRSAALPAQQPADTPQPAPAQQTNAPTAAPRRLAPLAEALATLPTPDSEPDTGNLPGLPTGLTALDQALGGLQAGRFYLIAAAPGAGASLLAATTARTAALTHRLPVLYAASGLTRADIAARLIAAHAPVDYRRLRAATLTTDEQQAVANATHQLTNAPLLIDDGSDLDAAAIASTVPDIPDLALLVVDRLQATHDPHLPLSGPQAIADAVQALAHLARAHHLPVLAALDTDDPTILATVNADLTLHLSRTESQAHLTVTERDLGTLANLALTADLPHARFTDPATPHPNLTDAPTTPPQPPTSSPAQPAAPQPVPSPAPTPAPAAVHPQTSRNSAYAGRDYSYFTQMLTAAVERALHEHDGDTEAATEALVKQAIPNGMELFEATRVGGNYEHTVYPETLDFLRKKTKDGADEIWEGRHNWENTALAARLHEGGTPVTVTALDTNAAYLSAFKTYLPIGALQHDADGGFDPKRSGIYRLPARPTWHHPDLPNPIGNRHEEGPLLLDDATIRLLIRCHKLSLCEAPHITEAWTSGATEGLLEKFRRVLTDARHTAIDNHDDVTLEYIKAMYAKFVSTIGESSVNRDIRRPDWMHIIRSQAFANLWFKAHRAHTKGLTIVRLRGTDELHITGDTDWRTVFKEGRLTGQLKSKNEYTLPRSRKTPR